MKESYLSLVYMRWNRYDDLRRRGAFRSRPFPNVGKWRQEE